MLRHLTKYECFCEFMSVKNPRKLDRRGVGKNIGHHSHLMALPLWTFIDGAMTKHTIRVKSINTKAKKPVLQMNP